MVLLLAWETWFPVDGALPGDFANPRHGSFFRAGGNDKAAPYIRHVSLKQGDHPDGWGMSDASSYPLETGSNERILSITRREVSSSPSTNAERRCSTLLQITPSFASNRTCT